MPYNHLKDRVVRHKFAFYVPRTLANLSTIVEEKKLHEKYNIRLSDQADKLHYLIHTLYTSRVTNKVLTEESFIPLHSEVLGQTVGRKYYRPLLNILTELGVVESDGEYTKGRKALGYRLTEAYRYERFVSLLHNDSTFVKGLIASREARSRGQIIERGKGREVNLKLYKRLQYDLKTVTIQYLEAVQYCINQVCNHYAVAVTLDEITIESAQATVAEAIQDLPLRQEEIQFRLAEAEKVRRCPEYRIRKPPGFTWERFTAYLVSIDQITKQQFFFTKDETGGRVHTNFTSLPSTLRKYIRLDGQRIAGADIRNSQPLLFALLVLDYYRKRNEDPFEIADVAHYVKLCLTGLFYDHLMNEEGIPEAERKRFKAQFFEKVFFNKASEKRQWKQAKAFQKQFPTVYGHLIKFKQGDFKRLAIMLQRKEAKLILTGAVKALYESDSALVLLTCHDAVYTNHDQIERVVEGLYAQFDDTYK